ncbi:LptF/LptG family permease [Planctomicrobium sp. SH661]|uniref:LptF/LptG family permease n=1 Tax=Planctomicrobium sp. SH661 TaxID=3448124 RepID=UPI003F5BECBA
MTTFDRYLLARYLHVVMVFTITVIGLFAIVDGFTNLDEFQHKAGSEDGTLALFLRIGQYYLFQSAGIVNTAGPTILVIAAMSTLALMLKSGEVHPVLAAGVPTYRATLSLVLGLLFINGLLIFNQEIILPKIAPHLQGRRGDLADDSLKVEPQHDFITKIFISGSGLIPANREMTKPEFLLPHPLLVSTYVSLRADVGRYLPANAEGPAGWLLENVTPRFDELPLTEAGRRIVIPQPDSNNVFVLAGLSFDQLNRQASNPSLVATSSLIQRLQQPSGTMVSRRRLLVKLHERLTRPILTLIGLYLVIPLIVRKEKMSVMQQVTNIATCMAVLGVVFGAVLGLQMLGESGLLRPEQAVWGPLVAAGGIAGWLSGVVRT